MFLFSASFSEIQNPQIIEPRKDENNNDNVKDSVVLPPNPIPPESQSNEKPKLIAEDKKDIIPDDKEKELNIKASDEQQNGQATINQEIQNGEAKPNIAKDENVKRIEEKTKQEVKSHQEKLDMMKHQQLVETIKQHGQEQKELIKEQKEILDELRKTKNELEKNKKETNSEDAKKIAVESIQKIANIAIQSLTGVSDKPLGHVNAEKKLDLQLGDNVKEVNKKTAENLNIVRINENTKQKLHEIVDANIIENQKKPNIEKNVYNLNELKYINGNQKPMTKENTPERDVNAVIDEKSESNKEINLKPQSLPKINHVPQKDEATKVKLNNVENLKHLHSPDEPQSYKEGEDQQKPIKSANNVGSVPLAIALSENSKIKQDHIKNDQPKLVAAENDPKNIQNIDTISVQRLKREVVDCTEKTTLKPEDKQICENLIGNPKSQNDEILPKVDLNHILSNPPLQAVHHLRSLKSYDIKEDK